MAKRGSLKPGAIAPVSGQYGVMGVKGGKIDREVTAIKGKPLPPTQTKGQTYILTDKTKHKR